MEKKAEILYVFWIFVLAIVAAVVVIGVLIYYSAEINVNKSHADILANRINGCMVDSGDIKFDLDKFNLIEDCGLNEGVFRDHFYAGVLVRNGKIIFDEDYGNVAHKKECKIIEKIPSKSVLRCVEKSESVMYNGNRVAIEIIAGINQEGKKIS